MGIVLIACFLFMVHPDYDMVWYGMFWASCLLIYKTMTVSTRYMYSDKARNDTFTFYY